jgi:hypothetical protein
MQLSEVKDWVFHSLKSCCHRAAGSKDFCDKLKQLLGQIGIDNDVDCVAVDGLPPETILTTEAEQMFEELKLI